MNPHDTTNVSTDWLNVTTPWLQSGGLDVELLDALAPLGLAEAPGTPGVWADAHGGTLKIYRRHDVLVVSASGGIFSAARLHGVVEPFLWTLADRPHRVTRIDVCRDVPTPAPPVLQRLWDAHRLTGIRLTRKASALRRYTAVGSTGEETGTIYIGKATAEVSGRVYDKREETLARGREDPGPLLRYEITVRGAMRPSLRDAGDPGPLYWHYAVPGLHGYPRGTYCSRWVPGGLGFDLEDRAPADPAAALRRAVEGSDTLRGLIRAADRLGPQGRPFLRALLDERLRLQAPEVQDAPTEAVGAALTPPPLPTPPVQA